MQIAITFAIHFVYLITKGINVIAITLDWYNKNAFSAHHFAIENVEFLTI